MPSAEKVVTLLGDLYYMYQRSPLNRTNLMNAFQYQNMKVCLPTRAGGTRWTGHVLLALDNFIAGYSALRLHLEQVNTLFKVLVYLFSFSISMTKKKFSFSWQHQKINLTAGIITGKIDTNCNFL